MTRALAGLLVALLAAVVSCSGSEGGSKEGETAATSGPPAKSPEETKREESLRKLRGAQDSAIEAMCDRFFDCAVEDSRKERPKELEGVNLEEMRGKHMIECEEEYGKNELSPRQVKVIQGCVNDAPGCEELQTCLAAAGKQG